MALIKNSPRENALKLVLSSQEKAAIERREANLKLLQDQFNYYLERLLDELFDVEFDNFLALPLKEKLEIIDLVNRRAKFRAFSRRILWLLFPVIGWIGLLDCSCWTSDMLFRRFFKRLEVRMKMRDIQFGKVERQYWFPSVGM